MVSEELFPFPCRANLHKWGLAQSPCACGQRQTMNHIVDTCPLTKFEGGLNQLHEVDDRQSYGWNLQRLQHSWHNSHCHHSIEHIWLLCLSCTIFKIQIVSYLSKVADFYLPHLHLTLQLGMTLVKFHGDLWRQKTGVRWLLWGTVSITSRHCGKCHATLILIHRFPLSLLFPSSLSSWLQSTNSPYFALASLHFLSPLLFLPLPFSLLRHPHRPTVYTFSPHSSYIGLYLYNAHTAVISCTALYPAIQVIMRHGTIRDAILTCARKPTWVCWIYCTESTTKKCKTEKLKSKNGYAQVRVWGIHVVSPEKEKERLWWEGFAEKEGFKPGMKEWVGDG